MITQSELKNTLIGDVKISTMTITCRFNTEFCINNIGKHLELNPDGVLSVKYKKKNGSCGVREIKEIKEDTNEEIKDNDLELYPPDPLEEKKCSDAQKRKNKKVFYNQATIKVKTKTKEKPINVKLFNNGSVQMTGCIGLDNAKEALNTLCKSMKKRLGYMNRSMTAIEDISFATNLDSLNVDLIEDLNICLINSGFDIGFPIDRLDFFDILQDEGVDCVFELSTHACVNIKLPYTKLLTTSVFIFEKGYVMITGAREINQVNHAYMFITEKMCGNYNKILKKDVEKLLLRKDVMDMMRIKGVVVGKGKGVVAGKVKSGKKKDKVKGKKKGKKKAGKRKMKGKKKGEDNGVNTVQTGVACV